MSEPSTPRTKWDATMISSLLSILKEAGMGRGAHINWKEIATTFSRANKTEIAQTSVENKFNDLKREYKLFLEAKKTSGITFDSISNRLIGAKHIVDELPEKHKKFFRTGFTWFNTLDALLFRDTATGKDAISTVLPPATLVARPPPPSSLPTAEKASIIAAANGQEMARLDPIRLDLEESPKKRRQNKRKRHEASDDDEAALAKALQKLDKSHLAREIFDKDHAHKFSSRQRYEFKKLLSEERQASFFIDCSAEEKDMFIEEHMPKEV